MKKLIIILLSVCSILNTPAQLVIYVDENGTPYTIDEQAATSVVDMDAFDAFLNAMAEASQNGDAESIKRVKALCKTKYNPSEIKKAKNHEMQAYLARCYELGVVFKQFGYNFPYNKKKAYNYYLQAIGGDIFRYDSDMIEQVVYRMGVFMLRTPYLELEVKDQNFSDIIRHAGWLIVHKMNADWDGNDVKPFYGYRPKAHLAARIISGEEYVHGNGNRICMYMYNDETYNKVRYHDPEVFQEAMKCYNVAAEGGRPEVQTEYAAFLMKWAGYYENSGYYNEAYEYREQALYWYKMAALQDYCPAIVNYSYLSKKLDKFNPDEVRNLLQKAATLGDTYALYNLAVLYNYYNLEIKDVTTLSVAFDYAKKGADKGNDKCAELLAYLYEEGRGTARDEQKAFYYYKQAADAGNLYCAFKTGEYYADKNYGNDMKKAFEYWNKTNGDVVEACERLANCYENGIGTIMDKTKAKYYRERYNAGNRQHLNYFKLAHYDVYLRSAINGNKLTIEVAK